MDRVESGLSGIILGIMFTYIASTFLTVENVDIISGKTIIIKNSSYKCKMINTLEEK